jgi:hypothetical protein
MLGARIDLKKKVRKRAIAAPKDQSRMANRLLASTRQFTD